MTPTAYSQNDTNMPDWYDPFNVYQAFPSGWDLSDIPEHGRMKRKAEPMPEWFDHFNDTHTFPGGWDLS